METLRVGDPTDKAIDIGAIVAPVQLERIEGLVRQGVAEGAALWQPSWSCPREGWFYPPTLFTDVAPAATIAQEEIFGPVLVAMTFRTPEEAVALANNTRYGLAASVWTENINLALDVAAGVVAGTVWINCTNQFDAASGFGGYRESGFGREGGREGMWEYLKPLGVGSGEWYTTEPMRADGSPEPLSTTPHSPLPEIDRTPKLFIGGKQVRPDQGYSRPVRGSDGRLLGEVGEGNRKDVRDAVEAAHAAAGWGRGAGHLRAQILYYIAENLSARSEEFAGRITAQTGALAQASRQEVDAGIARLFSYAAWADKYDGAVHQVPIRGVTLAMHEPIGVIGIAAPDTHPLLGFISLVAPAIALGNTVVVIPSTPHPLTATDFYGVLETSDLPDGVINIVTGEKDPLARILAEHLDVDAVWYCGTAEGSRAVEEASAGNMKRTWLPGARDWLDARLAEGREFLRHATQVKNIWIPYGE
jgi:aldehyde dehydrogenase (NAD+)